MEILEKLKGFSDNLIIYESKEELSGGVFWCMNMLLSIR